MRLLEFKRIGKEKHLTFESIQRFVFDQYSEFSEAEARQHLTECSRCYGIYESLVRPKKVKEKRSVRRVGGRVLSRTLLILGLGGITGSFLNFENTSNLNFKDFSDLLVTAVQRIGKEEIAKLTPRSPELEPLDEFNLNAATHQLKERDAPPVESIAEVEVDSGSRKPPNTQRRNPEVNQRTGLKEVYGRITADGEALKGVTVMVPGGNTAKVSDSSGRYSIQVPEEIASLVFIYRGKQTTKFLDPASVKSDVNLKIEEMIYPELEDPARYSDIIVSN